MHLSRDSINFKCHLIILQCQSITRAPEGTPNKSPNDVRIQVSNSNTQANSNVSCLLIDLKKDISSKEYYYLS